ncbi:MAG: hypothetical protein O3A00_27385 [Planctomycetota bacterium]|nr:hypothetical protein [Planctomycetota bacterium]
MIRQRVVTILVLAAMFFPWLAASGLRADDEKTRPIPVNPRLIRLDGEINVVRESFLIRQIERAVSEGCKLLIFQVNSFGGGLIESENLAFTILRLKDQGVRTVAFVPVKAISGAAIISLACDEIYMQPMSQIGDAGVIALMGEQFEKVPEKILSKLLVTLKMLADAKGRPPGLVMAISDGDLEVFRCTHRDTEEIGFKTLAEIDQSHGAWIKGDLIHETRKGNYFTVDAARAHELRIAESPVADYAELRTRLGIPTDMQVPEMRETWVDTLLFILNTGFGAFLLIFIGVVCIYLELHFTTGLFGIVSAVCFGVFFWSRFLGGTAGWLEVVLFAIGIVCIAMEIFVIPGFGVFGVSGGLLVLSALVMSSQRFTGSNTETIIENITYDTSIVGGSVLTVIAVAMVLNRFLPSIPLLNRMILTPPEPVPDSEIVAGVPIVMGIDGLPVDVAVGDHGKSLSVLRPAGKARIGDATLDVVSLGTYINQGVPIEVIEITGNRVVVREA